MPNLPEPVDIAVSFLRLLGVPLGLLLPWFVALWILGWVNAARSTLKGIQLVRGAARDGARLIVRQPVVRQVALYLSAAAIPAATYGFARLAIGLDRSGLSSTDTADTRTVVTMLTRYSSGGGSALPITLFWVALGCVITVLLDIVVFGGTNVGVVLVGALGLVAVAAVVIAVPSALVVGCSAVSAGVGGSGEGGPTTVVVTAALLFGGSFAAATGVFIWVLLTDYDT